MPVLENKMAVSQVIAEFMPMFLGAFSIASFIMGLNFKL